jgi:hypothetical protein
MIHDLCRMFPAGYTTMVPEPRTAVKAPITPGRT